MNGQSVPTLMEMPPNRPDRAGLVLSGGPGRRTRVDDRPQILCADGRRGAVALSRRSEARGPSIARMAVRVSASSCQIGEPFAFQAIRFRMPEDVPSAIASGEADSPVE